MTPTPSPGFGIEYGTGFGTHDEDGVSEAALPPTVRTSRPPSGLSHYSAQRPPSFAGAAGGLPARTPSLRSRRSSYSSVSKEKTGYAKNKLSAESWVRQNSFNDEAEGIVNTKEHRTERSVRRVNSQDSLRQKSIASIGWSEPTTTTTTTRSQSPALSRAEQIIAKATTPPLSSSRRRLYLTDSNSAEEQSIATSPLVEEVSEGAEDPLTPSPLPDQEDKRLQGPSPAKNLIVDSIPMRTSSLRLSHSSSPVREKKRGKKSKRAVEKGEKSENIEKMPKQKKLGLEESSSSEEAAASRKVDSVVGPAKTIPESSWADLGEEDDTVRRIRQLQEQRKSRLMDAQTIVVPKVVNATTNQEPVPVRPNPPTMAQNVESPPVPHRRPLSSRASNDPPVKAHKVLGIPLENSGVPTRGHTVIGTTGWDASARRRNLSLDDKKLQVRPGTSSSPTPPLSLDYSYAEAVDALQGVQRELQTPTKHRRIPSERTSEQLPRISAQYPGTQVKLVPSETHSPESTSLRMTKSQRRKQENRWTHYHPDLPLEFEKKKNRRKSTSDARNTSRQYADLDSEALPGPRRDSIEIAVTEYLQHNRMSRKIKHPISGRVISFSEVGDRNGAAVFVCVGMGLTRYVTAFYDELATTLRLRLITVDRPGVGGSEPYPPHDRSGPLNWPEDILAVCEELNIQKFSMVAHSAGAIYTLATALIMPHMIHGKVHLLAPWIPPSQLGAVSHSTASAQPAGALPRSQRILRVLPTTFLKAANSSFMTATSASLRPATKRTRSQRNNDMPSPGRERPATRDGGVPTTTPDFNRRESMMLMDQYMPDINKMENMPIPAPAENPNSLARQPSLVMTATATPMDPSFEFAAAALNAAEHTEKERKTEYTSRLTERTWDLAVKDSNPATDLLVCLERHRSVGFRYTDVSAETVVTHGSEDKRVPLANVRWLVDQMNRRPNTRSGDPEVRSATRSCELRVLEGEGHGLMASPSIMGDVLTEIAGYWKGW